ncbi:MAG TPA: hypothetical protein PLT92_03775 [Ignavibacteriaceae bacterium]|nr:hypothetical protein [Ignavibacteriaceae bacterium]HOJ17663.1 hypothetical protein [Ignavibacteriaceae bacterium]HPO56133.1 hypothetical protein [Ignavibacteriaceae bacterium]
MKVKVLLLFFIICVINIPACTTFKGGDTLFVAFYNLENLFDNFDDPEKIDEEYIPGGKKEWTEERLVKKMANLTRVVSEMNNGKDPDILGFCESENEAVAQRWVDEYFGKDRYRLAYKESPDGRGIDVGLIYKPEKLILISVSGDTVPPVADLYPTRMILHVKLQRSVSSEVINVFVNHWPSRRGGDNKTELYRIEAAKVLRKNVNKLFSENKEANVIIMGDFNDEPDNISITEYLNALSFFGEEEETDIYDDPQLFNLATKLDQQGKGTYKYQDQWNMLDQIIVSTNMIRGKFKYIEESFEIFNPGWLQTYSGKYKGTPFPTYGGSNYLGGFSDHFPVTASFLFVQ